MQPASYHTDSPTAFDKSAKPQRRAAKPHEEPPQNCEAASIAANLGQAIEEYDNLDAQPETPENICWIKTEMENVYDRSEALRDMLSCVEARSATGANAQIAAALDRFYLIWDHLPEEALKYSIEAHKRALLRLLYSALEFHDNVAPVKVSDFSPFIGNRHCNPWKIARRPII